MLVTFRSTATESITLFNEAAVTLIKMMGATGRIPGALSADDVPAALRQLETAINDIKVQTHAPADAPGANEEDAADNEENDAPVEITTRAVPLISMMKRAAAAHAELMWEKK